MELVNHNIENYPWLIRAYKDLTSALNQGRAHHAQLISHITGSGEEKLLTKVAIRLLCLKPTNNQPCEKCHSCELFSANNHPDYHIIAPEKNRSSISVDQIRQISHKIYERAQQGGNKVVWIKTASLMTESAANSLLKTLEEPPENTYFLLSDKHNRQLLPTIRSRCQFYFLAVPKLDTAITWLKKQIDHNQYHDNQLATALLINSQAPLAALSLLQRENWQERINFLQQFEQHLAKKDLWPLRDVMIQNSNIFTYLAWFCLLLSDALKAKQKAGRFIINRDQVALIRLIAMLDTEKIIALYTLWLDSHQKLEAIPGLNQDLIVSNLLAQSEIIIDSSVNKIQNG